MQMLMTQRLDPGTEEHLGGLYLNIDHISSIYFENRHCRILMSSGVVYCVAHSVSEILEMIPNGNYLD
jgi:uncharacterized protein YlzI (FlbEa/FlbD family)